DPWWRAVAWVARALLWPHPLIHWLARREAMLSERAADDCVLRSGAAPHRYATALSELAAAHSANHPRLALTSGTLGTRHSLEGRIRMILESPARRRSLGPWAAGFLGLATVVVALGVTHPLVGATSPTPDDRDQIIRHLEQMLAQRDAELTDAHSMIRTLQLQVEQLQEMAHRSERERHQLLDEFRQQSELEARRGHHHLELAQAEMEAARRRTDLHAQEFDRLRAMRDAGRVSDRELREAELRLTESQAALDRAHLQARHAEEELSIAQQRAEQRTALELERAEEAKRAAVDALRRDQVERDRAFEHRHQETLRDPRRAAELQDLRALHERDADQTARVHESIQRLHEHLSETLEKDPDALRELLQGDDERARRDRAEILQRIPLLAELFAQHEAARAPEASRPEGETVLHDILALRAGLGQKKQDALEAIARRQAAVQRSDAPDKEQLLRDLALEKADVDAKFDARRIALDRQLADLARPEPKPVQEAEPQEETLRALEAELRELRQQVEELRAAEKHLREQSTNPEHRKQ
ncbi:MAG: hypothetical protein KDC38_10145, partial [Planctomycetes bacterium]|nr:hypothetical protein [Planctomycetota bacterium]